MTVLDLQPHPRKAVLYFEVDLLSSFYKGCSSFLEVYAVCECRMFII